MEKEVRTAVITGATGGLGAATARLFDRRGWRLLLVARDAGRLAELAAQLREAETIAVDLTDEDAPEAVRAAVADRFSDRLGLLVNNAGASWRAAFGDAKGGHANIKRTMDLNFDAAVRLTQALLPALRATAPSSIVNVASMSGRVGMPRAGAYTASKFAMAGWTEVLHMEERRHGVHVGLVLPGFVSTPGFPQTGLRRRWFTRWILSTPERIAQAVYDAGPGGRAQRYVPRPWWLVAIFHALFPWLFHRLAVAFAAARDEPRDRG